MLPTYEFGPKRPGIFARDLLENPIEIREAFKTRAITGIAYPLSRHEHAFGLTDAVSVEELDEGLPGDALEIATKRLLG